MDQVKVLFKHVWEGNWNFFSILDSKIVKRSIKDLDVFIDF